MKCGNICFLSFCARCDGFNCRNKTQNRLKTFFISKQKSTSDHNKNFISCGSLQFLSNGDDLEADLLQLLVTQDLTTIKDVSWLHH